MRSLGEGVRKFIGSFREWGPEHTMHYKKYVSNKISFLNAFFFRGRGGPPRGEFVAPQRRPPGERNPFAEQFQDQEEFPPDDWN